MKKADRKKKVLKRKKTITTKGVDANKGFLGKDRPNLLKALIEEKPSRSASGGKREREL